MYRQYSGRINFICEVCHLPGAEPNKITSQPVRDFLSPGYRETHCRARRQRLSPIICTGLLLRLRLTWGRIHGVRLPSG